MSRYRIVQITRGKEITYQIEKRVLWFWLAARIPVVYNYVTSSREPIMPVALVRKQKIIIDNLDVSQKIYYYLRYIKSKYKGYKLKVAFDAQSLTAVWINIDYTSVYDPHAFISPSVGYEFAMDEADIIKKIDTRLANRPVKKVIT